MVEQCLPCCPFPFFNLILIYSVYFVCLVYFVDHTQTPNAVLTHIQESQVCIAKDIHKMNPRELWVKVPSIVNSCSKLRLLHIRGYSNRDEIKYHMLIHTPAAIHCTVVSLGIGKDTAAEQQLQIDQPLCHFYGADPVADVNREMYGKFGTFFHTAVGGKNGSFAATVLEADTWDYRNRTVEFKDLYSFLRDDVKQTLIDQLWIDVEYAEYGLLHKLLQQNRPPGVVICQINIEIHAGNRDQIRIFHSFFTKLIRENEFVPLRAATMIGHLRLYLFNVSDPQCKQRYLGLR